MATVYFSLDTSIRAVHRDDEMIKTGHYVSWAEFAPRVTASAAFRTTHYGDSLDSSGDTSGKSIDRDTGEFAAPRKDFLAMD